MQTDFIALYRGQTVSEARIIAITAEPEIVSRFVRALTGEPDEPEDRNGIAEPLRLVRGDEE